MAPWNPTKAKVQLRLSVQRLRTLQEKKEAQAKATRRDVATLLERGKLETARIKVENIINEDIYLELLELLELYCELLIARFGLLDQNTREPDTAVSEGVCAIIHAAPRTELKGAFQLHILRDLLMHKYGRDFSSAVMENRDGCVTERVVKKLVVDMPSSELVDAYLVEIAKGYNIQYQPLHKQNQDDGNSGDEGGVKEGASEKSPVPEGAIAVAPGAEASDKSTLKLPDLPPTEEEDKKETVTSTKPASKPRPKEDDFDVLAQRFAALKKR
ncbi:DUF292-domain-containing protein [Dentipellis sp. KUC8613]|nr:DUF292-domain-containing protein [Dentipellis sp. KUC8613]